LYGTYGYSLEVSKNPYMSKKTFRSSNRSISAILLGLTLWLLLGAAFPARASFSASGVYDEQAVQANAVDFSMGYSNNATWTTGIGQELGADQIIDVATFSTAVAAAFLAGHGGVVDFGGVDPAANADIQAFTVPFADGAKSLTFVNRAGHGGAYSIAAPRSDRTAISGSQFLGTSGNPHFDFELGDFVGFDTDEQVTAVGVTLLGRDGQGAGRNFRVIAYYTDGTTSGSSSTFRTFDMENGNRTQDSFSGIVAPAGFWITRMRVHSDSGVFTSIDDVAFMTSVIGADSLGQLAIHDDVLERETARNMEITMTGRAELHIVGRNDPVAGSTFHLDSPDAWLFFRGIQPSVVAGQYLGQVRVNGRPAGLDQNVRVAQYAAGAVIIPHGPEFEALEVFSERHLSGQSTRLGLYTYNNDTTLGAVPEGIRSFRLRRGYMATVAQNEDGTGVSQNYVAQDGDIAVSILPSELDQQISFIRVFPWRWTSKKGYAGGNLTEAERLETKWRYNWDNNVQSTLDIEYVPIRHNRWWPSFETTNSKRNVTHFLGFNEPDQSSQADMTVNQALDQWPRLMESGLRLGSPATTDGGLNWLYEFMDRADARGYRVDFVVVHFYRGGQSLQQFQNYLRQVHDRTGRPIWLKEFNNGANWTCCLPTYEQNAQVIGQWIQWMESTPWIERYSIYRWVQAQRDMFFSDGSFTPAGIVYRDQVSRLAYQQVLPAGSGSEALYAFGGDLLDHSGNGNNGLAVGVPTFVPGRLGTALALDGAYDYVQLPPTVGNSSSFTFAAWINWAGGANWQRIFDLGDGTDRYLTLTPKSGGNTLRFTIRNGGTTRQIDAPALTVGGWRHVAVTIQGSSGRLYVDGELVAENPDMVVRPSDVGVQMNYLGKSQFSSDPLFNGKLEDVRFLSRALSAGEIGALAAVESAPAFGSGDLALEGAVAWTPYLASIADELSESGAGGVNFMKLGGPSWLSVAADGRLMGVPGSRDVGRNTFRVAVRDSLGNVDIAKLTVEVREYPGLQALYEFAGNTDSEVGAAHGEPVGSPSYVSVRRVPAINFNGLGQHVRLPSSLGNSAELTVAAWVLWREGESNQRIFDFGNGSGESMYLSPAAGGGGGKFRFVIKKGGVEQIVEAEGPLATDRWYHVSVTLGGGEVRLYQDGQLRAAGPVTLTPADLRPASNFIGRAQQDTAAHLNGGVRQFAIFNRVLSESQIQELRSNSGPIFAEGALVLPDALAGEAYVASVAGLAMDPDGEAPLAYEKVTGPAWLRVRSGGQIRGEPGLADAGYNLFTIRASDPALSGADAKMVVFVAGGTDLVAHYQFQGNARDSAGGPDGNLVGPVGFASGIFDEAASFDGAATYVTLPDTLGSLAGSTLAMRIRWDGGPNWQRIFEFGNSLDQRLFLSPSIGNTMRLALITSREDYVLDIPPLVPGEWYHLALVLDTEEVRLYVNGVLGGTMSHRANVTGFSPAIRYLGRSQTEARHFKGLIDDFRIYGRTLQEEEIGGLASAPFMAPTFEESGYGEWAAGVPFPPGLDGPGADPDGDGVANLLEFLFDGDPLIAGSAALPVVSRKNGNELGAEADPQKNYLVLEVRVRKDREGTVLIPQGAVTLKGLNEPEAPGRVRQAGAPVSDGEFEVITYYFVESMEDSTSGRGFVRLWVGEEEF